MYVFSGTRNCDSVTYAVAEFALSHDTAAWIEGPLTFWSILLVLI